MERQIIKFITTLRSAGVRISIVESIDALTAVELMGIKDREAFRICLRATLIKDFDDLHLFDEVFPYFFPSNSSAQINITHELTHSEKQILQLALEAQDDRSRRMLERMLTGRRLSLEELDQAGKMVGLYHVDDLRYREWMVLRMKRALGFKDINNTLQQFLEELQVLKVEKERLEQISESLRENQIKIHQQLEMFAGKKISSNLVKTKPEKPAQELLDQSFSSLTDEEMMQLRKEVHRLARILRTRVALRQKRSKSGQLDAKSTIRTNLRHGNVPFIIKHRNRILKPKLVVICDVSSSMRFCSELMLGLVYALQDQVMKTASYAFIDDIEDITADLSIRQPERAVKKVLDRMPAIYANTDLGKSLKNFSDNFMDKIDKKTTLIIVGDGRNNYNDPGLEKFKVMARRSRRTIWLNPETPSLWGSGDSDMLKYVPFCDDVLHVKNLAELSKAVDQLLVG